MHLIERARADTPKVNLIWRFYRDSARHWKWQRLAFDGTVIEHSTTAYSQYEACLANASEHGYVSFPSLSTKAKSTPAKVKRSSIRFTTKQQKSVPAITALEPGEAAPTDDAPDELITKERL